MRINKDNTIGLVIDVQEGSIPGIENRESFISNCLKIIEGIKILNIPIVVTQQQTDVYGSTISELSSAIGNFSYIEKRHFSCYREPNFIRVLNRIGKRNVVMIGMETHISIMQTTLDLLYNNFNPVVVTSCVVSRNAEDRQTALWRMRDVGAIMSTTESILFELCRETGTPEFQKISTLLNR